MSKLGANASPQQLAEHALAASTADGAVVLVEESSTANLRWASNTLTTNGVTADRKITVISTVAGKEGIAAASVSQTGVDGDSLAELVRASERAAVDAGPAPDANPLLGPDAAPGLQGVRWEDGPAATDIDVFTRLAPALGQAFEAARSAGDLLFGYAEHEMVSAYLASSTGLRLRHDQPSGTLQLNAKSPDFTRSAWVGKPSRDFTDVDVVDLATELGRRLEWQKRKIDLPAGRYETVLPPTAVADLVVNMYWASSARAAADGRSVFSAPGAGGAAGAGGASGRTGRTKVGQRMGVPGVRIWSDPAAPGLECSPFVMAAASSAASSVFDNGQPLTSTDWMRDGVLERLITTRHSAKETGLPSAPAIDNLLMEAGGSGSTADLARSTENGLLLTCLWYIRMVDPQSLLLTGLTRDGVYKVEGGEVVGHVNNFRFNESPADMLNRITESGASEVCLSREIGDYFSRTSMPALRIADFNMSSVSKAS